MARLLAIILILLAVSLSLSCGNDDAEELTLEQYFAQISELEDEARLAVEELGTKYPEAFAGDVQQTKDSYAEYNVIFDDSHEKLSALNPPAEAQEVHDEGRAIDEEQQETNHARAELLEDATTPEDVDEIFENTPDYIALNDRRNANCFAKEALAAENDLAYDNPSCGIIEEGDEEPVEDGEE